MLTRKQHGGQPTTPRAIGKRIALVTGYWGTNIGNAFFNLGGLYALQRAFPSHNILPIHDQLGYWTFNRKENGNPRNSFSLIDAVDVDMVVAQGPLLTRTFAALWEPTLQKLAARGVPLLMLGAAFFRYSHEEIQLARKVLKKYPPLAVSTRDSLTYEALFGHVDKIYDGIDSAFFVSKAYQPAALLTDPYVVINFDRRPEPNITVQERPSNHKEAGATVLEHESEHWSLHFPVLQDNLSRKGKAASYLGALLDRRRMPEQISSWQIVRPEHRTNPYVGPKIFRWPNGFASDEPFSYLTLYANSRLTLTDRVHAAVATLAYGRPAMLFSRSPRAALFDRLGLNNIRTKPTTLDRNRLEYELVGVIQFLQSLNVLS